MSAARQNLIEAMHARRDERIAAAAETRRARFERLAAHGWIAPAEAARILCCSPITLSGSRATRAAITSRSASDRPGATPRGAAGLVFLRADAERVAAIRKRCRVGLAIACRIYLALKDGPL